MYVHIYMVYLYALNLSWTLAHLLCLGVSACECIVHVCTCGLIIIK